MKTQSADTSVETERVLIELARKMAPERKLQLAGQLGVSMRNLMRSGLRQRHPNASAEELEQKFIELWLGPEIAPGFLRARAQKNVG